MGEPDLTTKLEEARRLVDAMTPEEREAMLKAQRESWVRGMVSCEHGIADFEQCDECREGSAL